jgi:hypothetical protein
MRPLSALDIVHIWEWGQAQHPIDRALTILSVACPEFSPEQLVALPIGQRDAYLLGLRAQTFGAMLHGGAPCPQCAERLELPIAVADLCVPSPSEAATQPLELVADDCAVHFRLPNSEDLAALVGCADVAMAHSLLIRRCVVQASRAGRPILSAELPVEVLDQLVQRMAACDPQAEVLLNLHCPACGYAWQLVFDIVEFLWSEICTQAQRMLRDVHTLARAYGWREADILSMSALRRQFYLNMVMQ